MLRSVIVSGGRALLRLDLFGGVDDGFLDGGGVHLLSLTHCLGAQFLDAVHCLAEVQAHELSVVGKLAIGADRKFLFWECREL